MSNQALPTPITITAAELAPIIGASQDFERLIHVGSERVNQYAPFASSHIKNEALIRFCGYLAQSDYGGIMTEGEGPQSVTYVTNHADAWRRSGAAGLLTPWEAP